MWPLSGHHHGPAGPRCHARRRRCHHRPACVPRRLTYSLQPTVYSLGENRALPRRLPTLVVQKHPAQHGSARAATTAGQGPLTDVRRGAAAARLGLTLSPRCACSRAERGLPHRRGEAGARVCFAVAQHGPKSGRNARGAARLSGRAPSWHGSGSSSVRKQDKRTGGWPSRAMQCC